MRTCPICQHMYEIEICPICGFDESLDFENHPTLLPIRSDLPAVSGFRAWWDRERADDFRCKICGSPAFIHRPGQPNAQCASCGASRRFHFA